MSAPLVSVLMATYDGRRFVRESIESVLAQTHPAVELIVCDDGSHDDTPEIVASFGARVRLVRQANAGVSAARNRAAAEARGVYLGVLDQDDAYLPDMLERQVEALEAHPEWGFVYGDSEVVDAEGRVHGRRGEHLDYASGELFGPLLAGNFVPLEALLFRADLFRELGGFRTDLRLLEDWDLCLRAARRAPAGYTDAVLGRYRIHDANLSHAGEGLVQEYADVLAELADDPGLDAQERALVAGERRRRNGELAWYALRRGDREAMRARLAAAPGAHAPLKLRLLAPLPDVLVRTALRLWPRRRLYGV